jgi:hypothetical protein
MRQIILVIAILLLGCQKHRKINVDGTLTDFYTGQRLSDVNITLVSEISSAQGPNANTTVNNQRTYKTVSNSDGNYSFKKAYFSKPLFTGSVGVDDEMYHCVKFMDIQESDTKTLGRTKLERNLQAISLSNLNLTLQVSNSYNWYAIRTFVMFKGTNSADIYDKLVPLCYFNQNQSLTGTGKIPGYTDGISIIKTDLADAQNNVFFSKLDTVISNGPTTVTTKTIVIN